MLPATESAAPPQADFEFQAGPHDALAWVVTGFEATESISLPFSLSVDLAAGEEAEVDLQALIGEAASLTVYSGAETGPRMFQGIVSHVSAWDAGPRARRRRYRVTVVPALERLRFIKRSRIFQNLSVPQIAKQVLDEGKIEHKSSVTGVCPPREYCVQYNESDLEFVTRILAEEGIYYYFEHTPDAHTLVLADRSSGAPALSEEARLVFRDSDELAGNLEHVHALTASHYLRPGKVTLRDYDYLKPAEDLTASASASGADEGLEVYEYPALYSEKKQGDRLSKLRLEEVRARAEVLAAETSCRRLLPGVLFELDEHPEAELNQKYFVVSVRHLGRQHAMTDFERGSLSVADEEQYRAELVCLPATVPFRPERPRRPVIHGVQTAVVTGMGSEEIHTDSHARIKVQFHWDREGKRDDASSCWVRVSQLWAGPGWGALYLPRVGHEVLVEFLEGNPDRPLVTGSVYNGANAPPYALPDEKSKSTLRSCTTPDDGIGHNELTFEDAKGAEEVYLHAQKNLSITVKNDKSQSVGGSEGLSVGKDRSRSVGGNQTLAVTGNDSSKVSGNQTVTVEKDRSVSVTGNHTESIKGGQTVSVGGMQTTTVALASIETVGAAKMINVGGAFAISVGAAMNEAVAGLKAEQVGGAKTEVVGAKKAEKIAGSRQLKVGGDLTEAVKGSRSIKVGKDLAISAKGAITHASKATFALDAKEIALAAEDGFAIVVGSAQIEIKKNGDITIKGNKIDIKASGKVIEKGSKIEEN
jgi:type VI secretion system secreted protein VgrG